MTLDGWIIMALSVGFVSSLMLWCLIKVFESPKQKEHMHGFEFETPDEKEAREEEEREELR